MHDQTIPCCTPKNAAEVTTAVHPPSPCVDADNTSVGHMRPTHQPMIAMVRRPYVSASAPTRRFVTDLNTANGTKNDDFDA